MSTSCVTVVRYSDIPKGEDTLKLPKMLAVSMGRCNTGLKFSCRSFKAQGFPWALIEAEGYFVWVGLGVAGQVGFSGEVLPQQAVGISLVSCCQGLCGSQK
jgi:hypothetical protein